MFNIISILSLKLKPLPNIPRPLNIPIIKVNEPKSHKHALWELMKDLPPSKPLNDGD